MVVGVGHYRRVGWGLGKGVRVTGGRGGFRSTGQIEQLIWASSLGRAATRDNLHGYYFHLRDNIAYHMSVKS